MNKYEIVAGYRIANTFPCFIKLVFRKDNRYYIQISNKLGKIELFQEISNDFFCDKENVIDLKYNRRIDIDDDILYGFAFSNELLIIKPIKKFCSFLNKKSSTLNDVLQKKLNKHEELYLQFYFNREIANIRKSTVRLKKMHRHIKKINSLQKYKTVLAMLFSFDIAISVFHVDYSLLNWITLPLALSLSFTNIFSVFKPKNLLMRIKEYISKVVSKLKARSFLSIFTKVVQLVSACIISISLMDYEKRIVVFNLFLLPFLVADIILSPKLLQDIKIIIRSITINRLKKPKSALDNFYQKKHIT